MLRMCRPNGLLFHPGGPLVFEVGYHPRKKNHVIRVVFQDQAMYARTSFRGAKTCKIGKKGYVFGHMTNFGKDMTDKLKKNTCKNAYLGSIFIPEKYVFRVCFESPFTRMISNLKYKWPPRAFSAKILRHGSHFGLENPEKRVPFHKNREKMVQSALFEVEKPLEMGPDLRKFRKNR